VSASSIVSLRPRCWTLLGPGGTSDLRRGQGPGQCQDILSRERRSTRTADFRPCRSHTTDRSRAATLPGATSSATVPISPARTSVPGSPPPPPTGSRSSSPCRPSKTPPRPEPLAGTGPNLRTAPVGAPTLVVVCIRAQPATCPGRVDCHPAGEDRSPARGHLARCSDHGRDGCWGSPRRACGSGGNPVRGGGTWRAGGGRTRWRSAGETR
jgi:hypothetical protein